VKIQWKTAWREFWANKDLDKVPFDQLLRRKYAYDPTLEAQSNINLKNHGFKNDCLPPVTLDQMIKKHPALWEESEQKGGLDPERVRAFYLDNLPICLQNTEIVDVCTRAKVAAQARRVNKQFARMLCNFWYRWMAIWQDGTRHFWKYGKLSGSGMNMRQLFNRYNTGELEERCNTKGWPLMDCPGVCKKVLEASVRTNKAVNNRYAKGHNHRNLGRRSILTPEEEQDNNTRISKNNEKIEI